MLHPNHVTKAKSLWPKNKSTKRNYLDHAPFNKVNYRLDNNQRLNLKYSLLPPVFQKTTLINSTHLLMWNNTDILTLNKVYYMIMKYTPSNSTKSHQANLNKNRGFNLLQLL